MKNRQKSRHTMTLSWKRQKEMEDKRDLGNHFGLNSREETMNALLFHSLINIRKPLRDKSN